jgi:hypothetical protein
VPPPDGCAVTVAGDGPGWAARATRRRDRSGPGEGCGEAGHCRGVRMAGLDVRAGERPDLGRDFGGRPRLRVTQMGAVRSVPPGAASVIVLVRRGVPGVSGWGDQIPADPLVDRFTDNLYSACYVRKTDNIGRSGPSAGRGSGLPVPARAPALPGAAGQRAGGPRAVRAGLRDLEHVLDQARAVHLRACSHLAGHEADDAHVRPEPGGGGAD